MPKYIFFKVLLICNEYVEVHQDKTKANSNECTEYMYVDM